MARTNSFSRKYSRRGSRAYNYFEQEMSSKGHFETLENLTQLFIMIDNATRTCAHWYNNKLLNMMLDRIKWNIISVRSQLSLCLSCIYSEAFIWYVKRYEYIKCTANSSSKKFYEINVKLFIRVPKTQYMSTSICWWEWFNLMM